jgi:hypothetical protein
MLNVDIIHVIKLSVVLLINIMQGFIILDIFKLRLVILSVVILFVVLLNVNFLNVVAPR